MAPMSAAQGALVEFMEDALAQLQRLRARLEREGYAMAGLHFREVENDEHRGWDPSASPDGARRTSFHVHTTARPSETVMVFAFHSDLLVVHVVEPKLDARLVGDDGGPP